MTRHYFADFDLNNQAINNATGVGGGGGGGNVIVLNTSTIRATVNQSVPDSTFTEVVFDVEDLDEAGWVDLGANNTRITVAEDGVYSFTSKVRIDARTDYELYESSISVNGVATDYRYRQSPNTVNTAPFLFLYGSIELSAGDYIELRVFQRNVPNSAIDIDNTSTNAELTLQQLGGGSGGSGSGGGASTLLLGLGAWWKLDEVSGDRGDSSGNGWTLTDNNTVTSQAGLLGNEAVFVAANTESLTRPSAGEDYPFKNDQSFSFSGWVTFDTVSAVFLIASVFSGTGDQRKWQVFLDATNVLRFVTNSDGTGPNNDLLDSVATYTTGTRYHVVVTYDSPTNAKAIYVDGTLEASSTASHPNGLHICTESFALGAQSTTTPAFHLDGKLDECAYWSRALTSDEVSELYNSGSGITFDDLASGSGSGGGSGGREVLTANRTYYVATTGSDSNDGLTVGNPFLTIQKAIDVVGGLDTSIYNVTIQLADGTYNITSPIILKDPVGNGTVTLQGNTGDQSLVIIDGGATSTQIIITSDTFDFEGTKKYSIEFITMQNPLQDIFRAQGAKGLVTISDCNFTNPGSGFRAIYNLSADNLVNLRGTSNFSGSGSYASFYLGLAFNAQLDANASTINVSGSPTFTNAFFDNQRLAILNLVNVTVSGSYTGTGIRVISGSRALTTGATVPGGTSVGSNSFIE